MKKMEFTPDQLALLSKAATNVDDLMKIIFEHVTDRYVENAVTKLEEAFSWIEKIVGLSERVPKKVDAD